MANKRNILIIVEGAKTDVAVMKHLLEMYGISSEYRIYSFETDIYTLYQKMFLSEEGEVLDPADYDLIGVLREHYRKCHQNKENEILRLNFTNILLVFDLDPHSHLFSNEKIKRMVQYFTDPTDMGKLYINYPMVESFYHLASFPDKDYLERTIKIDELASRDKDGKRITYKMIVNEFTHSRNKYAQTKSECNILIKQNIEKSWHIIHKPCDCAGGASRFI